MTTTARYSLIALAAVSLASSGCRQRMADQPYYRPLEQADFFPDGRASRPIERGTVHRAQRLETDPIATGLTFEEWVRAYDFAVPVNLEAAVKRDDTDKVARAIGAPRYAPNDADLKHKVYVTEFPFQIKTADLKRGQDRYTIYCAVCHGPLGNGQGKIKERGYLHPTSFHSKMIDEAAEKKDSNPQGVGTSRGYSLWGHTVKMEDAPVGYFFEVITKGYGGMPNYSAQISAPDRWRIIAYIRVLQMSQHTDRAKLPPEIQNLLPAAGGTK